MPTLLLVEDIAAIVDEIAEATSGTELLVVASVDEALVIARGVELCLVLVDPVTVGSRAAELVFGLPHAVPIVLLPTALHVALADGVHGRRLAASGTIRRLVDQHCSAAPSELPRPLGTA